MAAWHELRSARSELAAAGRDLLYPHGMGLGFLATVRPDGGPRLHPMWPLLTDDELFAFIIPSPKQADLRRDGRYVRTRSRVRTTRTPSQSAATPG